MRERSELWKTLAARGKFRMDSYAKIGGVIYTAISAPKISRAMVGDSLSVGNCMTAALEFSVLTDDEIPKGAEIEIFSRLVDSEDDEQCSEWKTFGVFYIAKRDEVDNLHTLECYDSMHKASALYVEDTEENRAAWNMTQSDVIADIAEKLGVGVDARTHIRTSEDYSVPFPAGFTMQEVLEQIAACNGGNFVITPDNELRLIPLVSPPAETYFILDHNYNRLITPEGYRLIWKVADQEETLVHAAGGGLINVPVVIGKLTTGKEQTYTRVTMRYDETIGYTAGNDTGETLLIEGNPYTSEAITDDLYRNLYGLVYAPFDAETACYDPATELGDWVIISDKVRSVLFKEVATLDTSFRSNISAPVKDETESEYPFATSMKRAQQKAEYAFSQSKRIDKDIAETRESVLTEVARFYATKNSLNELAANVEGIGLSVEQKDGETYLKFLNGAKASQIKLSLAVDNSASRSTITLKLGDKTVASESLQFTGVISTEGLSDGTLAINGECIKSGKISAEYLDIDLSQCVSSQYVGDCVADAVGSLAQALTNGQAAVNGDCISGTLSSIGLISSAIAGCSVTDSEIYCVINASEDESESNSVSFVYSRADGSCVLGSLKTSLDNAQGEVILQTHENVANIVTDITVKSQRDISLVAGGDIFVSNMNMAEKVNLKDFILGVVAGTY